MPEAAGVLAARAARVDHSNLCIVRHCRINNIFLDKESKMSEGKAIWWQEMTAGDIVEHAKKDDIAILP